MDIPNLSVMSSQTAFQSTASLLIMKKVLDSSTQNGQDMVALLDTSTPRISPSNLGQAVDISV